jgi:hypothetical protein
VPYIEIQRYLNIKFKKAAAFKCFKETKHAAKGTIKQVP